MFDIINKNDLFSILDSNFTTDENPSLKNIQDGYAKYWLTKQIQGRKNLRVLEMGGGNSRVARWLALNGHSVVNLDKFEGQGQGPTNAPQGAGYEIIKGFLGDFSNELVDGSFDLIYSISVIEHVEPVSNMELVMQDAVRLLKTGGKVLHLIDTYMFDNSEFGFEYYSNRIEHYDRPYEGIKYVEDPVLKHDQKFSSSYATNSDFELWRWQKKTSGNVNKWRMHGQSCSIKASWVKI